MTPAARSVSRVSEKLIQKLTSKAKGLFTRRARHPNTSQLVSPMTDVRQDSVQLMVPEEVADELPNMSSDHPSVSLNDPSYDGSRNNPTSDQHAQRQSDKLPTTDQSTHEGQIAHGAKSNDSATSVTDKPGLDEANEACQRYGILLGSDRVDYLAVQIHPYVKAAWGVLSVVSKTITSQATRDDSISQLSFSGFASLSSLGPHGFRRQTTPKVKTLCTDGMNRVGCKYEDCERRVCHAELHRARAAGAKGKAQDNETREDPKGETGRRRREFSPANKGPLASTRGHHGIRRQTTTKHYVIIIPSSSRPASSCKVISLLMV
ncbi:uncharacterized protein F5147DRAFT_764475 [Suillus discolor]|uniref:Uncharacterized protein n=1 Tax=Suillus discolor TaxID=1912936 RepID=A0A9P7ETG6_9AGAM|nr:uncharacterized protein F5147DRAFT_764475 [Suillus discolor]KAG2090126.1 hypothetical protein F5147DRAFT_764475 [Suillus discolor]